MTLTTGAATVQLPALSGRSQAILSLILDRCQPVPDGSGDGWLEASARFVGVGLGLATSAAHRLLHRVAGALGMIPHDPRQEAPARLGVDLRAMGRLGPLLGTVWRVPAAALGAIREALRVGSTPRWAAPAVGRQGFLVQGIDPSRERGSCRCPNLLHDGRLTRAAYQRHEDGSWHVTCQVCRDASDQPLVIYAVPRGDQVHGWLSARTLDAGALEFEAAEPLPAGCSGEDCYPPPRRAARQDPAPAAQALVDLAVSTPAAGCQVFVPSLRGLTPADDQISAQGDSSGIRPLLQTPGQVRDLAIRMGTSLLAALGLTTPRPVPAPRTCAHAPRPAQLPAQQPGEPPEGTQRTRR